MANRVCCVGVLLAAILVGACSTSAKRENTDGAIDPERIPIPKLTGRVIDSVGVLAARRIREAGGVTYAFVAVGGFVALIVVAANLMATVALFRTSGLTRFQKVAQGVIVWMLPFIGAFLVR